MKYKILLTLFSLCLISSLILSFPSQTNNFLCSEEFGCGKVQNSPYSYTLNVKNSNYGIIIFALLIILTLSHIKNPTIDKKRIIHISIIIGFFIAIYFLFLQEFVIKAYCTYCLIVDVSLIISMVIILKKWKKS
ncbi:MAG: vitamin K epoxide reductase family protein [Nanoarchaeota archaeon]